MTKELVPIQDHKHLVRDIRSGAILNIDNRISASDKLKLQMREQISEINSIKEKVAEIDIIKSDLCAIKELLQRIVDK